MACALDLYMTFVLRIGHMHNANTFAHMFSSKWPKSWGVIEWHWPPQTLHHGLGMIGTNHAINRGWTHHIWCMGIEALYPNVCVWIDVLLFFFRTFPHSICSSNSAACTEWTRKHWLNICCAYFGNAKNIETFQYAGRFMGILVMVDYDPHETNWEVSSYDIPCINYINMSYNCHTL